MGGHVVFTLEPFCALNAVELAQAGKILGQFGLLVVGEVLGGEEV